MADRPPLPTHRTGSLLVYGSLMHPRELRRYDLPEQHAIPVLLQGYVRTFHQEPIWRIGTGEERGVLTVHPDRAAWLNAVLLCDVPAPVMAALDHRERGYVRTPLAIDQLSALTADDLPDAGTEVFVYTGRPERFNPALRPLPAYRDLCIAAASVWGEEFAQMFLQTTFVDGRPLRPTHV